MFGLGAQELIIILAIAFFIFGAKRLPELGKSLGQGIRGFKGAMTERPQIEASREVNNQEDMAKK
jgi:sec-independent protein translocase protein TatA